MNLVTDSLQRTCTGTIIVQLRGSVWDESERGNGQVTTASTEDPQRTTRGGVYEGSTTIGRGVSDGTYQGGPDEPLETPLYGDNVHFGPAGIGLLIMGFLVLGCKRFNPSSDMCLSKNVAKEISPGVQLNTVCLARIS